MMNKEIEKYFEELREMIAKRSEEEQKEIMYYAVNQAADLIYDLELDKKGCRSHQKPVETNQTEHKNGKYMTAEEFFHKYDNGTLEDFETKGKLKSLEEME